jgi:recombination protein RecA
METQEMVVELKKLTESGTKVRVLEEKIGLPLNSLSSVLSGKKDIPVKNLLKVKSFLDTLNAPEISDPIPDIPTAKIDSTPNLSELRAFNLAVNKQFGEGAVMLLGDKEKKGYDVISTGSLKLDWATGIGGFPRGRMVELYGLESGGKTTITTMVMANAQKMGLRCMLIDAENAFDPEYAASLGLKVEELIYCQPDYGEQGMELIDKYILAEKVQVVVVDSVATMIPKAELEGTYGESKMGLHARMMSQACRKLTHMVSAGNVLLLWVNQIRNKIGVMYGSPEVTTGGMALQFYASMRLDVRRGEVIKNGAEAVGHTMKITVKKNKCAAPFKVAEVDIIYGKGVDEVGEIVDMAINLGIITASGSWYSYDILKLGQGKAGVKELLEGTPDLKDEILAKIKYQTSQK